MFINLEMWKKNQIDRYKKNQEVEHVFEEKEYFIIIFDKNMKDINYKIKKNIIFDRQSLITKIFDMSNITQLHNKLNKKIYKELHQKFDKYLFLYV